MGFLDFFFGEKKAATQKSEPQKKATIATPEIYAHLNSIKDVAMGGTFDLKLYVSVVKQPYNGDSSPVPVSENAYASLRRSSVNGEVEVRFSNIEELREKGIIHSNLSFIPVFSYKKHNEDVEFASATLQNYTSAANAGKEFISLFQVTKQKGEIVSFMINNLPNEEDFYYMIMFRQNKMK